MDLDVLKHTHSLKLGGPIMVGIMVLHKAPIDGTCETRIRWDGGLVAPAVGSWMDGTSCRACRMSALTGRGAGAWRVCPGLGLLLAHDSYHLGSGTANALQPW
jgi:hypothetical protein